MQEIFTYILNLINSTFFNFTKVFFEKILSKIFKFVKTPSVLFLQMNYLLKKNKIK